MVFEDELKQTDKKKSRFGWVFKLVFVLAVIAVLVISVLSMIGGNGPSLRKGAEDYIGAVAGMDVTIGTLNEISFFPRIVLDMEDIVFTSAVYTEQAASVEKLYMAMPFWRAFIGKSRAESVEINNITARPGVWGPRSLSIRKVALEPQGDKGAPALTADGKYGDDPFNVYIEMLRKNLLYGIKDGGLARFSIGDLRLNGKMYVPRLGGLSFVFDEIFMGEDIKAGTLRTEFSRNGGGGSWDVDLSLTKGATKLEAVLSLSQTIEGRLDSPLFDIADLDGEGSLRAFYERVVALAENPAADTKEDRIDLSALALDLDVDFARIVSGEDYIGALGFNVTAQNGVINAGPFKGTLYGGQVKGDVDMNAQTLPAKIKIVLDVLGLDYVDMNRGQESMTGEADIHVKLDGEGESYEALWNSLDGSIAVIGGEGHFKSAAMNLWGTGLLTTMVPSLDPESEAAMNCMIAMFKVEDGVAKSDAVFMDMKRLTIAGEGEISLPAREINLRLKPSPKGISLGDMSVPVRIKGPLFSPSVGVDRAGLGMKLGQLLLGTINPAFWAYSLADLGLTENHPCRAFIEAGAEEAGTEDEDTGAEEAGTEEAETEETPAQEPEQPEEMQPEQQELNE